MKRKSLVNEIIGILPIIIIAFLLRFYAVNWGFPKYFGGDEMEHARSSLEILINPVHAYLNNPYLSSGSGNTYYPPVFHYLLLPFTILTTIVIFVYALLKTANFANAVHLAKILMYENQFLFQLNGRILSALMSVGSLILVYILARKLFGKKIAILSSLVYAFVFQDIVQAHFCLPNTALTFFQLLTIIAVYKLSEKFCIKSILLIGFLCAFTLQIKWTIWPLVLLIFVFITVKTFKKFGPKLSYKCILYFIFSFGISTILLFPTVAVHPVRFYRTILTYSSQLGAGQLGYTDCFWSYIIHNRPKFNMELVTNSFWGALGVPLTLFGFLGIFYYLIKKNLNAYLIAVIIIFDYIFIEFLSIKGIRHLLPIFPLMTILAVAFIIEIGNKMTKMRKLSFFFVAILILPNAVKCYKYLSLKSLPDTRVVSEKWIVENIPKGSKIANYSYGPRLKSSVHKFEWLKKHNPEAIKIFRDFFSKNDKEGFLLFPIKMKYIGIGINNSEVKGLDYYTENEVKYLITSSYWTKTFYDKYVIRQYPNYVHRWQNFLKQLNQKAELIKEFTGDGRKFTGPDIKIYRLSHE